MTAGRRALLAVLQATRARHVAETCGVHPSRVSRWAAGTDVPSETARRRLAERYEIPADAWEASTVYASTRRP